MTRAIPQPIPPSFTCTFQMPRSNRRATTARPMVANENLTNPDPSQRVTATSSKKARHRLSTAELTRLEDVFRQETHPSRQQKKDLATQLGMDYKTVTIWFQNKRQTSKRGQLPVERPDSNLRRTRADSCLRTVSSPSHNATLDAPEVVLMASSSGSKGGSIASKAAVKIKPLLDSLNALTSRSREHSESQTEVKDEVPNVKDVDPHRTQTLSEHTTVSGELNKHDRTAEQEQTEESAKTFKWKRIRTLEWACERQAKRRKLSKEVFVRFGSAEIQNGDPSDTHMDSALSLLALASSAQVGPPKDVMRGASLLLSFKHSWRRKQQDRF